MGGEGVVVRGNSRCLMRVLYKVRGTVGGW